MARDVLYTDWSQEYPDPVWCDECSAEISEGEVCTCPEAETEPAVTYDPDEPF